MESSKKVGDRWLLQTNRGVVSAKHVIDAREAFAPYRFREARFSQIHVLDVPKDSRPMQLGGTNAYHALSYMRKIDDGKFKTFGCGSASASSSLATEWLKGKTVDEALAIRNTDIVTELSLPPVKIHCSVLAEDAIKAAIGDYKKKQQKGFDKSAEATAQPGA